MHSSTKGSLQNSNMVFFGKNSQKGGGKKKFTKFPNFTWEIFRNRGRGGGQEFSQSSQVHKKGAQKGLKTPFRPYIF